MRAGFASVGVLVVAILLTGCGGKSVANDVRAGVPDGVDVDPMNATTAVGWVDRGETFAIVTWGSSSCPPIATALTTEGEDRIAVTFEPSPNEVCTADMAPTTHEFDLPNDVTSVPVTVDISYGNEGETRSVTLD